MELFGIISAAASGATLMLALSYLFTPPTHFDLAVLHGAIAGANAAVTILLLRLKSILRICAHPVPGDCVT